MEAIRIKDDSNYFSYDDREGNAIEVRRILKGDTWKDTSDHHSLLFIMEGSAEITVGHYEPKAIRKGFLSFVRSGDQLCLFAKGSLILVIVRTLTLTELNEAIKLAEFFNKKDDLIDTDEVNLSVVMPSIWHYLKGLYTAIADGIRSKGYFDAKIRELYMLLYNYYSRQELFRIFHPALSNDIAFSDAVKTSWFKYKTIDDLAEAMRFTPSSFYRHFQKTFGCTAQQWITEQKKILIYRDLMDNEANFKELADKYWFSSVTSFYNWCVKTYGSPPGDMRKKLT
ncbi:MAG: helix-turn-helix transcriptional regulator [Tannerellaceae bacterium]|jgi:AraC-like DNA-binding protein|nr:helix-turn-helix transcriptional regulator [Tannerellaceae bacterium]